MKPIEYNENGECNGECAGCVNEKECNDLLNEELKIRSLSDLKWYLYHEIMTRGYYVYYVLTYKRRVRRLTARGMLFESDLKGLSMSDRIFQIECAEFVIWQHSPEGKKEMSAMKERTNNIL